MSALDDPRVLFAAERTLMAWSRTAAGLMAFGFVIDRTAMLAPQAGAGAAPGHQRALGGEQNARVVEVAHAPILAGFLDADQRRVRGDG